MAVWCMHLTFPFPLPSIHPHSCPLPCWLVSQFISLCLNRSFACLSQISPCLLNKLELSSGEQTKALNQLERVLLFKNLKVSLPLPPPFLFIYLNVYFLYVTSGSHFHCVEHNSPLPSNSTALEELHVFVTLQCWEFSWGIWLPGGRRKP